MGETKVYDLNVSQQVCELQCKYSLFNRVINILFSVKFDKKINLELMQKAFNEVVKRNDSLRLKFIKQNGKLKQYFEKEVVFNNIPKKEFTTQEEFDKYILKYRKKAIAYKKGVVIEPTFCVMPDGKLLCLFKVCHLVLDVYGINIIVNDLCKVYDALENNQELPTEPVSFEKVLQKDLENEHNKDNYAKNKKFLQEYFGSKEEPYYAGIHGDKLPLEQKMRKKGKRTIPVFFVNNDTEGYMYQVGSDIVVPVLEYCKEAKITPSNFFFYAMSIVSSKMNGNVKNLLPLELCNCRGTLSEKKSAGCKVQAIFCYTQIDFNKPFDEALVEFSANQQNLYRYLGFPTQELEVILHKTFKSSVISTYYSYAYSFIPFMNNKDVDFQVYSNGKGALAGYVALMWDVETNVINIAYDCQTKITNKEDVILFHNNYIKVLKDILANPKKKIEEITF